MADVLLHNTKLIANEAAGCVYEYAVNRSNFERQIQLSCQKA